MAFGDARAGGITPLTTRVLRGDFVECPDSKSHDDITVVLHANIHHLGRLRSWPFCIAYVVRDESLGMAERRSLTEKGA